MKSRESLYNAPAKKSPINAPRQKFLQRSESFQPTFLDIEDVQEIRQTQPQLGANSHRASTVKRKPRQC